MIDFLFQIYLFRIAILGILTFENINAMMPVNLDTFTPLFKVLFFGPIFRCFCRSNILRLFVLFLNHNGSQPLYILTSIDLDWGRFWGMTTLLGIAALGVYIYDFLDSMTTGTANPPVGPRHRFPGAINLTQFGNLNTGIVQSILGYVPNHGSLSLEGPRVIWPVYVQRQLALQRLAVFVAKLKKDLTELDDLLEISDDSSEE